ncbi:hypothetical protein [Defluviitalea raffinosedens]|uniref:hypothetical protein n=1 Tax=Defluviitalea raffinosedens TaxID=1450156 RepID=UPI00131D8C4A|nr:hypothetical protein [Defluviitalea raffinosedens]
MEDYLTINKSMDINALLHRDIEKGYFVDSIKTTIKPLFQIAYNQGYSLWHEDPADNGIIPYTYTQALTRKEVPRDFRLL